MDNQTRIIQLLKNNLMRDEDLRFSIDKYKNYVGDDVMLNIVNTSTLDKISIEFNKLQAQDDQYIYNSQIYYSS